MQSSHLSDELQAALQYVVTSEIPGEHKRVLIEVITTRLRSVETDDRLREAQERESHEWHAEESAQVVASLQGKRASSWQNADETLMSLAARLHRDPRDVRRKASELGLAAAVDFSIAKSVRS